MANPNMVITIDIRWWVAPYLSTIAFLSYAFGCQPDMRKVARFIVDHGMVLEVLEVPHG